MAKSHSLNYSAETLDCLLGFLARRPQAVEWTGAYPSTGGGKHKDFGTQHRRESNQYPFVGGKIWQFSSIMVQLKRIRTLHFLCLVPFMYKTSLKHVKSNVKPLLLNFYVYY